MAHMAFGVTPSTNYTFDSILSNNFLPMSAMEEDAKRQKEKASLIINDAIRTDIRAIINIYSL